MIIDDKISFFQHGGGKVYDCRPQDQMSLLDVMNAACEDITADHCRDVFEEIFPWCMAMENTRARIHKTS